jgi:Glycosyl hydrolase family 12
VRTLRRITVITALAAAAVLLPLSAQAASPPPAVTPAAGVNLYNTPVCGSGHVPIDLGHGDYFNVFNAQDHQTCISAEQHHLTFGVDSRKQSNDGWQYVNVNSGWEWGTYTCNDGQSAYLSSPGSQCMRYPVQEDNDGTPLTSAVVRSHVQAGDVAYDIWFNTTDAHPNQDNGAEVMIWLNHPGVIIPKKSVCWDATIQGVKYEAMCWRDTRNGASWNYVAYVALKQTNTLAPTWLNAFFRNTISHGKLSAKWYLTGIDFGSEMSRAPAKAPIFEVWKYNLTGIPTK